MDEHYLKAMLASRSISRIGIETHQVNFTPLPLSEKFLREKGKKRTRERDSNCP
jgi:hypothetical protein